MDPSKGYKSLDEMHWAEVLLFGTFCVSFVTVITYCCWKQYKAGNFKEYFAKQYPRFKEI